MRRSRSSFDLDAAVEKVTAMTPKPSATRAQSDAFDGVNLVSFAQRISIPPPQSSDDTDTSNAPTADGATDALALEVTAETPISQSPDSAPARVAIVAPSPPSSRPQPPSRPPPSRPPPSTAPGASATTSQPSERRPLPVFPELSGELTLMERCAQTLAWAKSAACAEDVFLVDDQGLLIAGSDKLSEARLASCGGLASAIRTLSLSPPMTDAQTFDVCLGEGPVLQLLGFAVSSRVFVIGLSLSLALDPAVARAIRTNCHRALGAALRVS